MKRGVILFFVLVFLVSAVYAQNCDYDPVCDPNIQSCGCGGTQTRYTLCDGGCSDWYSCSVADTETDCDDSLDNDCDNLVDCEDSDCENEPSCIDEDDDGFASDVDCDETDPNINPGASEVCNNMDDNCDGYIDEGLSRQCGQTNVGICTIGSESCTRGLWIGCNAVLPITELCGDNIDNDCDGEIDEGCNQEQQEPEPEPEPEPVTEDDIPETITPEPEPEQFTEEPIKTADMIVAERPCIDLDGDTYGVNCPNGFDCDDSDAAVNPAAVEVCNNRDDDCNNIIDDQLTRPCGTSDIGTCTFGTERCIAGAWSACTAVFPKEEVCNNKLDDNCDGEVDEGCDLEGPKDELALRQFMDLKLGKGNYDWDKTINDYRKTSNYINIKKSSTISDQRTTIHFKIIPIRGMRNLTIFEYIPKYVAHSAQDIKFSVEPEVIQDDPLVAWHFAELNAPVDISYEVIGEIENAHQKTETIAFSEGTKELSRSWYFNLIPLLIIPIIGFVFIFLAQATHKKKQ